MHLPLGLARVPNLRGEATARQRRAGVAVLLGNTLLMNFGFSMLIPLLAIHFTGSLGFTAASIGLVLALRQFSQQGLDLVGGVFGDRFGARSAITIGCFIRAAGFFGIGISRTLPSLILFAVLSGIGGAFFDACGTAALADLVAPHNHQRVYAASATLGNVGTTVGPLLGVALLGVSFVMVGAISAGCFVFVGLLTLVFLPASALRATPACAPKPDDVAAASRPAAHGSVMMLLRDRTFVLLTALLAGYWFLWAQMNISVPLVAARMGGPRLAALAFAANAGPAILLQYPTARYIGDRWSPRLILTVSVALCGAGMALAFISPLVPVFFLGVVLFALARMVIGPTINAVTAELAPAGRLGAYFGFGALAVAIGAGFGQYAGGVLYDAASALHQPAVLWATLAAVGIGSAIGLARLPLPARSMTSHQDRRAESLSAPRAG